MSLINLLAYAVDYGSVDYGALYNIRKDDKASWQLYSQANRYHVCLCNEMSICRGMRETDIYQKVYQRTFVTMCVCAQRVNAHWRVYSSMCRHVDISLCGCATHTPSSMYG